MMRVPTTRIRTPVRRNRAEFYILLTLLSFGISVSLTRLFLELTGYPQLGGGELHIAHVLWGGLLLFIAALLPLIFANRWVYTTGALLAGIGVGLFIDEVGKFITQSNNYFYPAAAPIIYGFFLVTVLLYTQVKRRHSNDPRAELYSVLDDLEEVLDYDLSEKEKEDIVAHLQHVSKQTDRKDITSLTKSLEEFILSDPLVVAEKPGFWARLQMRAQTWADRWLTRGRLLAGLAGGFAALAIWALYYPLDVIFAARTPLELQQIMNVLVNNQLVRGRFGLLSFQLRLGLEVSAGLLLLLGAIFIAIGRIRRGLSLGYIGLLVSLAMVDVLVFYFDQFSTIINAVIQLVLLLGILYFRRHFPAKTT